VQFSFAYNLIGPQVCISSLIYYGLLQLWQMTVQYVSSGGRLSLLEVIKAFRKEETTIITFIVIIIIIAVVVGGEVVIYS
jgi:hypothetical protein